MAYDLQWLDLKGLCHKCGSQKKFPGRKFCPDCLEKMAENRANKYDPTKAHEYQPRRREIYQLKKKSGICVRCTKIATNGMYCLDHYLKEKRRSQDRARKQKADRQSCGLIPKQRTKAGLCLWCGAPATGRTLACDQHRKMFSEAGKRGGKYWKELNNQIFRA